MEGAHRNFVVVVDTLLIVRPTLIVGPMEGALPKYFGLANTL